MLTQLELRDRQHDVIAQLEALTPPAVRASFSAVSSDSDLTLLHAFIKYRSADDVFFLVDYLGPTYIATELSKWVTVTYSNASQSQNKRVTGFHILFKYQSAEGINGVLKQINTASLHGVLTTEETLSVSDRLPYQQLIRANKLLKGLTNSQQDNQIVLNDQTLERKRPKIREIPYAEELIQQLSSFRRLVDQCQSLSTEAALPVDLDICPETLALAMLFHDEKAAHAGWSIFHYACAARRSKLADQATAKKLISSLIDRLSTDMLTPMAHCLTLDPTYRGCNLLHFILFHLSNQDEIQAICIKADDETLNTWLCGRSPFPGKYHDFQLQNWSALQMMFACCSQPTLMFILGRATPKTVYTALATDLITSESSHNTISFSQILRSNKKLKFNKRGFEEAHSKLQATYHLYELYHYFTVVQEHTVDDEILGRRNSVIKLIQLLEVETNSETLQRTIRKCYRGFSTLEIVNQHKQTRPFSEILYDICYQSAPHQLLEAYQACRDLYMLRFTPEDIATVPIDDEALEEEKQVRILSKPEIRFF